MEVIGYIASVLIGLSLGLIGGGGSILTVPVLVYVFNIPPLQATSYSLFIVGLTSLIGAWGNYKQRLVSMPTVFIFGASSIVTVLLTRRFIVPAIPDLITTIGGYEVTKSFFTMILFAVLMIMASLSMIKNGQQKDEVANDNDSPAYGKLLLYGILIGLVTGMLGAGGGFLLIPALVLFVKMPVKKAIGTSLAIIALNSLIGFAGDIGHYNTDWTFLLTISALAVAGIIAGGFIGKKMNGNKLKKLFGWFVLGMGVYIIIAEFNS